LIKHLNGELEHAMDFLKKALHIRRKSFGHDHFHTQASHDYHHKHFYDIITDIHLENSVASRLKRASDKAVERLKNIFK
jgi:hypothetical protein